MSTVDGAPAVLEVQGLNAFYGKSQVIFGLDLRVGPGEAVAVLGRNGAGKTTALMAIAGVVSNKARSSVRRRGHLAPALVQARPHGAFPCPLGLPGLPEPHVNENLSSSAAGVTAAPSGRRGTPTALPEARRVEGQQRGHAVRRRAPDARGGARDAGRPEAAHAGRAERGARADDRQGDRRAAPGSMRGEGIGILLTEQNHRLALEVADRVYFIEKGQVVWQGSDPGGRPAVIGRYLAV